MSLLTHGNTVQSKDSIVYFLDFNNKRSLKFPERIYDYGVWADGQTGSVGEFGAREPSAHRRVMGSDPWGNNTVLWEFHNDNGTTTDARINCDLKPIDNTKMYRMSFWENRVTDGNATNAGYYFGLHGYGETDGVYDSSGVLETNPYFIRGSNGLPESQMPRGQWVLVVGFVYPAGSSSSFTHPDAGVYDVNGNRLRSVTWYSWHESTTTARLRNIGIYLPDGNGTIHRSAYPRMDVIDGSEPSLQDLLSNNTDKAFNLINPSNEAVLINGPIFEDKGLKFDGVNDYVMTDFGEGIDLGVEELTIDLWVKNNSLNTSLKLPLAFGGYAQQGTNRRFYLSNTTSEWRIGLQNRSVSGRSSSVPATTDWTNITLICNPYNKTVKMYKDGVDTEYSMTHTGFTTYGNLNLGSYDDNPIYIWDGSIGLVRVWNKLLSDSEIKTNFEQFRSRYGV